MVKKATVHVNELEEFRVKTGDPRPILLRYILSLPNFVHAFPSRSTKPLLQLTDKNSLIYSCDSNTYKRKVTLPNLKRFKKHPAAPLVIIPIVLRSANKCKAEDTSRHMNLFIFNTNTKELERIDIKKYHLDGYSLKVFITRTRETLLPVLQTMYDVEDISAVPDADPQFSFVKAITTEDIRGAYPAYIIAYLNMRSQYPSLTSEEIQAKVRKMSKTKVAELWQGYVEFNQQVSSEYTPCPDASHVKNHATGRCVSVSSKAFAKHLINPPPLACKGDKIFDHVFRKCTTKDKLFDVDILYNDIAGTNLSRKNETKRFEGSHTFKAAVFVMSRYPYAYLIYNRENPKTYRDSMVIWNQTDESLESFQLTYPSVFWEDWRRAMYDPSVRFIVALVSIRAHSSVGHANVIIYDKTTNELERFDPHGRWEIERFNHASLDATLKQDFMKVLPPKLKYLTPKNFCPATAIFQAKEVSNIPGYDPKGNCAVWRLWYINLRLANPDVPRKELIVIAQKKLEEKGNLYKFIKAYTLYVLQNIKKRNASTSKSKKR